MATYKEYIVTLKNKDSLEDFYNDMEILGGSSNTPDRPVECACKRPSSRNTHYWLTPEEVDTLKEDIRVQDIELLPASRGIFPREHYEQTETDWDKSSTITSSHKNWGLLRCVEGEQRAGWGTDSTANESGSIRVNSSGRNVDVVIVDGGHFITDHPEFAVNSDGTGGSRVNQYNWFQHNFEVLGTEAGNYDYSSLSNHSAHVAGTVAGNTQGWARDANIYNISFNTEAVLDFVRAFHNNKEVNPETGRKNPTIVNNSWGQSYDYDVLDGIGIASIDWRGVNYPDPTEQELLDYGYKTGSYLNGLPARSSSLDTDVAEAVLDGLILVGSAGNSGMKMDVSGGVEWSNAWTASGGAGSDFYHRGSSPGSAEGMICVGSVDTHSAEPKSTFSNCGPRIDIFAPGSNITSSVNSVEYTLSADDPRNATYKISKISGTSMSSPQVCGILACALEQNPSFNHERTLEYLQNYSKPNQLHFLNTGGYQDAYDMLGSVDLYIAHHKERADDGLTYPKINTATRPSEGVCFPRPRIVCTKSGEIKATGGTITEADGYRIHSFTSDGTFEVTEGYGEFEYLVIAGGGGGGTSGANYCGGGGAGGLLQGLDKIDIDSYTVVVGAGGAAANNGQNSTVTSSSLTLTAVGGGAGASSYATTGNAGGSGGGGGPINGAGGAATLGQGNIGGYASSVNQGGQDSGAGGGGGAGSQGNGVAPSATNSAGTGGQGIQSNISGSLLWYAAGGNGPGHYKSERINGIGGATSGIDGVSGPFVSRDPNGIVNTGSGGGGYRSATGGGNAGGTGGSGIIIIRYLIE